MIELICLGHDHSATFRDQDGQEVFICRGVDPDRTRIVAVQIENVDRHKDPTSFVLRDGEWFMTSQFDKRIRLTQASGEHKAHLSSWLDGLHSAWLNSIMLTP